MPVKSALLLCFLSATSLVPLTVAFCVPLRRIRSNLYTRDTPYFLRHSGNTNITSLSNTHYVANITIGETEGLVILDTGSSDLWTTSDVRDAQDLGHPLNLSYAIGNVQGNIHTSNVTFADFSVPSQAFLRVEDSSSLGGIAALGITGLVGLGPAASSVISQTLGNDGDPLLENIFQLNKTASNFITFTLGRAEDDTQPFHGEFTIAEVIPGYESILQLPELIVQILDSNESPNQHWTVLMDQIIGPDGNTIIAESLVDGTPDGKLVAVLDSGSTLPQVRRSISDAIYGRVQGAEYSVEHGVWLIPCGQELNITMVFGDNKYPVSPLDTSMSELGYKFNDGSDACTGAPISTASSLGGNYDCVMGDSFLRNAYTLLNWGDFVSETSDERGPPFVQMLPLTDMTDEHLSFVEARLNGVDTTGDPQYKLLDHGQSSPVSKGERVQHNIEGYAHRHRVAIAIGASVAGALLFIIASLTFCMCRRRRRRQSSQVVGEKGMIPLGSVHSFAVEGDQGQGRVGYGGSPPQDLQPHEYRQVHDPASAPHPGALPATPQEYGVSKDPDHDNRHNDYPDRV